MEHETQPDPQTPGREGARPGESILDSVERRTGEPARLTLTDVTSDEAPLTSPAGAAADFVPRKRGDYHVLGEIARGGMGRILRAHDGDLGRDVAIKVLDPRLAGRADVLRRFVEEAQIGGQLQHPGVVPVYELGLMADERPYFTMKLVKGRTLADLLSARRSPEEERGRMLRAFEAVCQTVAYAHTKGVIHRDLKPANVMVGSFGEVQVVDWGLSKVLRRGGIDDELRAQRPDRTVIETIRSGPPGSDSGSDSLVGSVLGTPAYMPPEQARGEVDSLDERADVFALGAILCELLTGRPPYLEREGQTVLQQASQGRLEDAYARLEACGAERELVDLARACLAPAPGARLGNGEAVARAVHDHLAATADRAHRAELEAAEARVRAAEERKARRLTLALAVTGALATFTIGGGWLWRERREREEIERVGRGLEELRAQVQTLQTEGRPEEAAQVARNGLVLVDGRPEGDALRARAASFVAQAEELERKAAAQRERTARDTSLLRRLDELRLEASVELSKEDHAVLDESFGRAFRAWGLDVDADIVASLDQLRASGLEAELAPALDDWAAVRRWAYGWRSPRAEQLNVLAADLDPDEVRVRLREALMERDVGTLLEIAADSEREDLPASTLWVLGNALRDLGQRPLSLSLLERATGRYPGDLRLRITAHTTAKDLARWDVALRHISAAAALRPDLAKLQVLEGICLRQTSQHPAAVRVLERALEAAEDGWVQWRALDNLNQSLHALGEFERAGDVLESLIETGDTEPWMAPWLDLMRYEAGRIDLPTLEQSLASEARVDREMAAALVWVLLQDPSNAPAVQRAAAVLERTDLPLRTWGELHALLRLCQGRPQEALEALYRMSPELPPYVLPEREAGIAALRAAALAALGRKEEARASMDEAWRVFEALRFDEPAAWEQAPLLRDLRRAEAALGG